MKKDLCSFPHSNDCREICRLSVMDVYEVSLNYCDFQHGGDRRKRSQQCTFDSLGLGTPTRHKHPSWAWVVSPTCRMDLMRPRCDDFIGKCSFLALASLTRLHHRH